MDDPTGRGAARSLVLAEQLAAALDGEHVRTPLGSYVRLERVDRRLAIDRDHLAVLPGHPQPTIPLLCLDTETTGLATAAGTFVFLVGLGWWRDDRFVQVQLLLPDQSDEMAFLAGLRALIAPDAWLVTYNGRGFDWPLLVTRYRMMRDAPPGHAGHLDLLPFVRRVFRHRLPDARLRTVEREILGIRRGADVEGWEIPGRYLEFLRAGSPDGLLDVVRHNDEDVRSLARLLSHVATHLGDPRARGAADGGDLSHLARAYRRVGRDEEALECLEAALERAATPGRVIAGQRVREDVAIERARTLRRLGRADEALAAWQAIATTGDRTSAVAWIEVAKILEHRRRDPVGALEATDAAARIADRARALGRPLPVLEADVGRRRRRLHARLRRRRLAA